MEKERSDRFVDEDLEFLTVVEARDPKDQLKKEDLKEEEGPLEEE